MSWMIESELDVLNFIRTAWKKTTVFAQEVSKDKRVSSLFYKKLILSLASESHGAGHSCCTQTIALRPLCGQ